MFFFWAVALLRLILIYCRLYYLHTVFDQHVGAMHRYLTRAWKIITCPPPRPPLLPSLSRDLKRSHWSKRVWLFNVFMWLNNMSCTRVTVVVVIKQTRSCMTRSVSHWEMVPHGFWAPQSAACTVRDSPVLKLHLYIFARPTVIFFLLFYSSLKVVGAFTLGLLKLCFAAPDWSIRCPETLWNHKDIACHGLPKKGLFEKVGVSRPASRVKMRRIGVTAVSG